MRVEASEKISYQQTTVITGYSKAEFLAIKKHFQPKQPFLSDLISRLMKHPEIHPIYDFRDFKHSLIHSLCNIENRRIHTDHKFSYFSQNWLFRLENQRLKFLEIQPSYSLQLVLPLEF